MTVKENNDEASPTTCNYTSKASSSLLKLSTDLPCICDPGAYSHHGGGHLTGWGSIPDRKTDRRRQGVSSRTPRKPFPSRLYEATTWDSRSDDYTFRHCENIGSYMEQYRRDHTVMDTGRTRNRASDEMVVFLPSRSASNLGSNQGARKTDYLRLPSVRDKRSTVSPATVTIIDQHGVNRCQVREDSPRASSREQHGAMSVSRQNGQPAPTKTPQTKGKRKNGRSKVGNGNVGGAKSKTVTIDSYTGGTFVNIVGELRAEIVGSKLSRIGRNSAKTESVSSQSNSWFSLERSRSHLRTSSFGSMAPSGDRGINNLKQPIKHLGRDDVTQARSYETWESLWRDNFRTLGSLNIEGAMNDGPRNARLKTHKLENEQTDRIRIPYRASISPRDNHYDAMPEIALGETGTMTMTKYLDSRALFQANSFRGNNRHVTTRTRLPISQQRRAPPLSQDTIVVGRGSPLRTEEQYCIDK
ncbi:uncharacterized protein LOC119730631 [Patiria miniata]|uniref:Uncharacterized protein n=1 Tax=Patiria miniata TaxID=46514 RepID=A0A914A7Z2_PATMI|nr:uncharacterized protein LOC119730631 [Patiria miniata]